ncbi:MAG TPA: helix-turn-helix domain-containing protein [Candidatus Dormibacteraeota bacterium]|nr:helix-turn-helix domain-containing protein [Candidatus Dormibacteraeota bacterium]
MQNAIPPSITEARATLTVEEAAVVLGIGRSGAYAAARIGDIPVIRVGRRLLVPRAALEALLAHPAPPSGAPVG